MVFIQSTPLAEFSLSGLTLRQGVLGLVDPGQVQYGPTMLISLAQEFVSGSGMFLALSPLRI